MTKKALLSIVVIASVILIAQVMVASRDAYAQSVVGIWRSKAGICSGETILKHNGTFSKTTRCGDLLSWDVGTYTVGRGYIHLTIHDHEPKVYKGRRLQWVTSQTIFFRFAGPNRIICEDRVMGTRWEAYRVR